MRISRRTGALSAAGVAAVGALLAAGSPAATVAGVVRGVPHVYPAGANPENEEGPRIVDPTGVDNANDTVGDYLRYTAEAKALPAVDSGLRWRSKGPFGVDMPPGYSQSGERFARVTGMGTTVTTQPGNPDVVYVGNMGGLWKSVDSGAHWRNLTDGKLPRTAVGAVAIDPADPTTVYLGTGSSLLTLSGDANGTGIYVSHDGGASWTRPKQSTHGYGSNAIAVTPTAVFYGSNRGLFRLDKAHPAAGFVAVPLPTNAAGTAPDNGFLANWISDIAVKPGDPREVTVAVGFPLGKYKLASGAIASPGNGLYRSTDGGHTFHRLAAGGLGSSPTGSSDPIGRIRLAYGQAPGQRNVLWAAVSDAGLAAGRQPLGLDVVTTAGGPTLNRTGTTFNGLYRSGDDGATWTMKANPQTLETSENSLLAGLGALGYGIGVQGYYNLWVATDPKVPDQVYLGLEEVFQSQANAGAAPGPAKFTTIERYADLCGFLLYYQNVPPTYGVHCPNGTPIVGSMSTHPDQHAAVVVPTKDGSRIYTGNDGGWFRQDSHPLTVSTNPTQVGFDNAGWTALNTMSSTEPWHVAIKPDGEVLAALQDNGSIFVPKSGHGVEVCGGDGVYVLPTPNPDVWYCDTPNGVTYVTTDHGKTITAMPPGPVGSTGMTNPEFSSPVALDPTDPNHVVAAAEDVWETTKGPKTQVLYDTVATATIVKTDWTSPFDAGNSPNVSPKTGKHYPWSATALAVRGPVVYDAICGACRGAFTNPKLLKAAIATNVKPGCTPAKASSACWHIAKSIGLPKGWIASIVVDPKNLRTVYVAVGEENLFEYDPKVTGSAKVLVSHDGGNHFVDITGNLPRTQARGLVLRGNSLIVATDVGVFQDAVGDGTWARLGSGLPTGVPARDIYLDPTGRHVVVSMYGRGVWELTFPTRAVSNTTPTSRAPAAAAGKRGSGALAVSGLSATIPTTALVLVLGGLLLRRRRLRARRFMPAS